MSKNEKLFERFEQFPKDFTFDELKKLLGRFGFRQFNKGKSSGSRVIFKNDQEQSILVHKPHPDNIVKVYALKQIYEYLVKTGCLK